MIDARREEEERKQSLEPYEELAAAICARAADDYREARDDEARALAVQAECRAFFRSNACEILCGGDGAGILAMLDRERVSASRPPSDSARRLADAALAAVCAAADILAEAAAEPGAGQGLKAAALRMEIARNAALERPRRPKERNEQEQGQQEQQESEET